jgi:DNA-binding CsgD family transcriptional regulator
VAEGRAQLLERTDELAAVEASLRAARAGLGAMMLVEGPPGIGKTELLAAAMARARRRRMMVLSARGGELELSFPYAVVRQLFEPAVAQANGGIRDRLLSGAAVHAESVVDPHAEPGSVAVEHSAVLHGLYWLTAHLAADRPVLLVVDDLHWSDPVSVSWLVYLARRIEGLAVALILGARPVEPGAHDALLERLRATEGLRRVEPAPLSLAAVDDLARAILGDQVERAFSEVCHAATAGNPFYVAELLRALRQDGVAGTAASVPAIDGLTPRAVVDATLARLGRLPSEVRTVAEATALLEPRAELRWIAELTGLDVEVVAVAADSLLDLGMLRSVAPCRFEHPILRSAVDFEISPARRGRLHLKAARALAAAGMPVDAVAAHLMQAPPCGETWIVSTLQQAARQASARGAPGGAVAYLERALAEPPAAAHVRGELLLDLGKAENQMQLPQARGHLREALALAEQPDQVAMAALWLGQALWHTGAADEACEIISDVLDRFEQHESQLMLELQAYLLSIAVMGGWMAQTAERADALEARTAPASPAAGAVQATLAFRELAAGCPRERVRGRVQRALAGVERSSVSSTHLSDRQAPGLTLVWIDDLERAEELFTDLIKAASRMGRRQSFEIFSALRGYALRRQGDLADAAADIEPILATAARPGSIGIARLVALTTQVLLLVDDGRPQAAEELACSAPTTAAFERTPNAALIRQAQATAQLAQGKFAEAAATLTRVGEVCDANGVRSPAVCPWRSQLALALAGTDRHDEGLKLARSELRLAEQCDVDRARGVALRALGMLEGGQAGLRHLEAAVQALERSPARLELGWASYELGAALRRANRRRDARAPLDRALDLALACGAQLLAQHAREELQALGARPRSVMLTGAESLTPSERRACRLAAEGLKNAEIAQALFVSLKTVETHLRSAYRKLDIASRAELPQMLGAPRG